MIIRKMTASFGKLNNQTLELHEGLNVVSLPNESGKSTWSEFLLAMLYGVDTSERSRAGFIPVKDRFLPWSGSLMQGTVELEHNGQRITIERTSTPKAPMSKFTAYDTDTGLPIEGLDGKNCGAYFIGAERSVYERSGFLRQKGIGLSKDSSLEKRLTSLVSTAEEDYSYADVEKELNGLKNRCKHNQTGLIPAARRELSQVEAKLEQTEAYQQTLCDLQAREQTLLAKKTQLQQLCKAWKAAQKRKQLKKVLKQQTVTEEAAARREQAEAVCAKLPGAEELFALTEAISRQQDRQQAAYLQNAALPPLPQAPQSTVFAGLSAEAAEQRAGEDSREAQDLMTPAKDKRTLWIFLLCGGLALLCGILAVVLKQYWLFAPAALAALCIPLWWLRCRQNQKNNEAKAAAILAAYGAKNPEQVIQAAAQYAAQHREYAARCEEIRQQKAAAEAALTVSEEEKAKLLARLRQYFPDCDSLPMGSRCLTQAAENWKTLATAQRDEAAERRALELLRGLAGGDLTLGEDPEEELPEDAEQAEQRLAETEAALVQLRSELHRTQGLLDGLGDRLALEAEKEQLTERIETLEGKYGALMLAQETLEEANRQMQSRFAPQLCGRASELFGRLTGGKYDKLLLDRDLAAVCRQTGDSVTHTAGVLSCGTTDQLYLAVRLAICEMLLQDAPLILDDALTAFDNTRCGLAMKVLRQTAETRQVIVFTCQTRELQM